MARKRKDDSNALIGLGIAASVVLFIVSVVVVVLISPGAVFVSAIRDLFGLYLDYAQMWTFSTLFCIGLLGVAYAKTNDFRLALQLYLLVCSLIVAFYLTCDNGFKLSFPSRHYSYFSKPKEKQEGTAKSKDAEMQHGKREIKTGL